MSRVLFFISFFLLSSVLQAQIFKDGRLYLNEDGSEYLKITLLNQIWVRQATYNPGTMIYDFEKDQGIDLGIRRFRLQFISQLSPKVFIYSQVGINNFNFISERKTGFFVHDAIGEYAVIDGKLTLGAGLSAWPGFARYSSPSIGTILGIDVPLYQQATGDQTDQFLRRMSVYAKGMLGKVDYRISLAQPFAIQTSSSWDPAVTDRANFSGRPPNLQFNSYVAYQFAEKESMLTPFRVGSYLGKKEVFNIGMGMLYQKDAMWYRDQFSPDTLHANMFHLAFDVFYDKPVGNSGQSITLYANFTRFDYGPGHLRNLAVMNPANGIDSGVEHLNGSGVGFPSFGTGNVLFLQGGYKFSENLIGTSTLMPYLSVQLGDYEALNGSMVYFDAGINCLINGHRSKATLAYRNRPLFEANSAEEIRRLGDVVLQYQIFLY